MKEFLMEECDSLGIDSMPRESLVNESRKVDGRLQSAFSARLSCNRELD